MVLIRTSRLTFLSDLVLKGQAGREGWTEGGKEGKREGRIDEGMERGGGK